MYLWFVFNVVITPSIEIFHYDNLTMLLAREHEIKAGVNMKYTNTHKCQKSKPHYIKGRITHG